MKDTHKRAHDYEPLASLLFHYGSWERPELLTSESAALIMLPKEVTLRI